MREPISPRRRRSPASRKAVAPAHHELFLKSILENIPDMIFVKDAADLRFVRFNQAGLELLGLSSEEIIGKSDYDFFPKEEADFFTKKDRDVLAGGKLVEILEEPIHTRHRGVRMLHTKKIPILDEQGRPRYLLGISEDITERRNAADALKKANETLTAANQELEAFTYSVSHDLRAPLRAIEGFAQILHEDHGSRLDDEGRRLLQVIRSNTLQMAQLIDDLLAFSRIGSKSFAKFTVPMDLLARDVWQELQAQSPKTIFSCQPLPPAYGDRALLRQVLTNLCSNALKFSRGSQPPKISIGADHRPNQTVYFVRDNGVGFDMRFADKLFGVFQRLHSAEQFEGTGVGLAIVQRIVQKHGGRVWAESRPNSGATFYFGLPRQEENA